jgi:hypothetical protein
MSQRVKPTVKIMFFIGLMALIFGMAFAQITGPLPSFYATPPPVIALATNNFTAGSNSLPVLWINHSPTSGPLKPGIYQTRLYTCLVKVPGPQHDDCFVGGTTNSASIPTIKPDLQFAPEMPAGK